jgi:hypothetical protein
MIPLLKNQAGLVLGVGVKMQTELGGRKRITYFMYILFFAVLISAPIIVIDSALLPLDQFP